MQALAADPDIYEKLTASLAPSIWQLDDVKKGILCQLFGGTTKVRLLTFASRLLLPTQPAWRTECSSSLLASQGVHYCYHVLSRSVHVDLLLGSNLLVQ